tara:strand:+ start:285 stop:1001 length:717 start_codon:yes stop_codon:yes gene_type:complete
MSELEVSVPSDLGAIRLGDYMKYMDIIRNNPDANDEFLEVKMLEIFCGLSYKDVISVPFGSFNEIINHLNNLFSTKPKLKRRFSLEGTDGAVVEFGFVPNLDNISYGEYTDLNLFLDDIKNLNKAMAVLFRPIHPSYNNKESYRIASYKGTKEYSEILLDMPLDIAIGARVFFWSLGKELSRITLTSLQNQKELRTTLSEEERNILTKSIRDIVLCMSLQEATFSNWIKPQVQTSTKH